MAFNLSLGKVEKEEKAWRLRENVRSYYENYARLIIFRSFIIKIVQNVRYLKKFVKYFKEILTFNI